MRLPVTLKHLILRKETPDWRSACEANQSSPGKMEIVARAKTVTVRKRKRNASDEIQCNRS